jgi:DNA repair exonuclease SbcCD ATPase subunit
MSLNTTLPFMAQRKVEKRKFIEGILNLEIFSEMLLAARSEYNEVQKKYEHITKDFDHANNICKLLTDQKENIISSVNEQKKKILERVETIQSEIEENKSKIKSINKELFEKSKDKLKRINEKISDISTQLSNVKTKITRHETEIDFHNKKLNNIGTADDVCPTCLHQITNNDRDHIQKEKNSILKDIKNCEDDIVSLDQQIISIKDLKQNNIDAQNQINQYISNIKTVNNNNKLAKAYIKNLNSDLEKNNKDLSELQDRETSVEIQDLDNKINNSLAEVKQLEDDSNTVYKGLSTLEVVKYILSEEGVKSFIVKKILDVLNNRLLYYLQKMDANCICRFNEYFEEEIVNEKGEDCSYFNFSGAERKNIDLAILFTFMDMRRLQGDIAYNLVMFDELLDSSLDEKGVELVLNIIKERIETYSESIYIISHRKESVKAATGDVVVLEKKNGITNRVDLLNKTE